MASSGKQLNVKMNFQVDTTQAQQQLKGLYSQLNQITSASNFGKSNSLGITQEILQATKAAGQLKIALAEAINPLSGNLDLSRFNDQIRASGMSLSQYREQLSALGTSGNQTFNQLARSISTAEVPMLRMGKAAQTMWTVLGNTIRWQATSSMLHGIMSTASNAMSYVKSLDRSLNNIRIVTGQSQEQMARFAKTANQAAKELNTSTNEYAKASLIYYQQGLSNKQVEERTRTTIKLANVAGQSAKTVSDQMTAVWNNFYDGSKSLEYYADVITALGASTASSSEEIAKGLQKFSSIAQTTGLSYEYATSALSTVVAATRQSADSVGTSFKTLFSRLQGLSLGETLDDGTTLNKYSQALNTVGVNIKKANGDLKDMDTILSELGDKWSHLGQDTKIALAQTVGGVRNYTGLMSLMDHWDEFQVNLKTAQTAQGTLQNQADIYAESWQAASDHVKAASETIYKNLLDDSFFKGLTNGFGGFLDIIGEMTNQLGGFRGSLLSITNLATQFFRPQLTQGFANIGSTIFGLTKAGQQQLVDLRTEAKNAVTQNLRFSQYDSVNNLTHQYNAAFNQRQTAYDMAVEKGRISTFNQPVYQMMLNNMAQREQAIINAEEQAAATQITNDDRYTRLLSGINHSITQRQNELKQQLFTGVEDETEKKLINQLAGGRQVSQLSTEEKARYDRIVGRNANFNEQLAAYRQSKQINIGAIRDTLNEFEIAREREQIAAGVKQFYTKKEGNIGLTTADDMRLVASRLQELSSGSKLASHELDSVIPGLTSFNMKLEEMGGDVSKLSEDQLKQLLQGTELNKNLTQTITKIQDMGLSSEQIRVNLEEKIRTSLGFEEGQGKNITSALTEAFTSKDASAASIVARMRELGLNEAQQKAILSSINGEQAPTTIAMSGAVTTVAGTLSALSQTIVSSVNAVKTFADENATATQKISALGSTAMSIGMLAPQIKNFGEHMNDVVTIFGKSTKMSVGQMGIWGAVAALAIGGGVAIAKEAHKTSLNGAIENYNVALATSTQLANDAKSAYENLITVSNTHNNLLTNLSSLKSGTEEFTLALLQANDAATNIIEEHGLLYGKDYIYNKQGAIEFTAGTLQDTLSKAQEEMIQTSIGKQQISYAKQILETSLEKNAGDLQKEGYESVAADPSLLKAYTNAEQEYTISLIDHIKFINDRIMNDSSIASYRDGKWQFNKGQEDWLRSEIYWSKDGLHLKDLSGLSNILQTTSDEETLQVFENLLNAWNSGTAEDFNKILMTSGIAEQVGSTYKSERQLKNEAAIQGLVGVTLSGVQQQIQNEDLVKMIATNSLLENGQATNLLRTINNESIDSWLRTPSFTQEEWYSRLYGEKVPEGLSPEDLETKLVEGFINEIILNGASSEKLSGAPELIAQLEGYQGILEIADEVAALKLPNIENLSRTEAAEQFKKLQSDIYAKAYNSQMVQLIEDFPDTYGPLGPEALQVAFDKGYLTKGEWEYLDAEQSPSGKAGIYNTTQIHTGNVFEKYGEYFDSLYEQQLKNLEDALLVSASDNVFQANQIHATDVFSEAVQSYKSQLVDELTDQYGIVIKEELQYGSLKDAINILTNANQIGTETGQYVRDLLISSRTKEGTIDENVLTATRNFNYENSISGLYANTQLRKYAQNKDQRTIYADMISRQIQDMKQEKGFFLALYNSSGFADVMDSLNAQFQQTGEITAQNITDLASKSEVLQQALSIGAERFENLNVNAAGLASIFTEINKGTLTANLVTSELVSAMSTAGSGSGANTAAFAIADSLDLGRSGTELLSYFQDAGKAYYQAKSAGWGFYTEPMQNLIKMFGGSDVQNAYKTANQNTNKKASELFDDLPSYFTDFMYTMAGVSGKGKSKKAKGGGGPEDVWGYLYDMMDAAGLEGFGTDQFWNSLGFRMDEEGNFWLRDEGDGSKSYTRDDLEKHLSEQLQNAGLDKEAADNFASVAFGLVATSGQTGYELDKRGAEAGYKELYTGEGIQSEKTLRAYYNANKEFLNFKDFDSFYKDYQAKGGKLGFSAENGFNWGTVDQSKLIELAQNAGTLNNEGKPIEDNFESLASAYKAYDYVTDTWDYDQLVNMIESMNGTESDLIRIMQDSPELFENALYGKDKYGNIIKFNDNFTSLQDFVNRLNLSTGYELVNNRNITTQGAADVASGMAALYWRNPSTGELIFDPDGQAQSQYETSVSHALGKKAGAISTAKEAAGDENAPITDFSFLTNEEMNAVLDSTASKLLQQKQLTEGQQQFLELYGDGTQRDAKTNQLLTQILYNTDTVVDQNGELVDYASATEEQKAAAIKKGAGPNGEDVVVDEDGNIIDMPTKEPTPTTGGAGSGWTGNKGTNKNNGFHAFRQDDGSIIFKDDNGDQYVTGPDGKPVKVEDEPKQTSNAMQGDPRYQAASGQNNHLLAFAKGSEGHIAVTGELGPELRIKEDGSADLLGKKGREYAWVTPTDKIYTATQTASILGNNNIPALEGLARGIRNYIPGYETGADWNASSSSKSGSGGGSGGGKKKDERYDPNTLKIRDVLERYYTIMQKIDDITRMVEKFAQVAERAWGRDRIKAIEKQTDLYKQQYDAQKKYVNEIKGYLSTDENALTTMISEFVTDYNKGKDDKDKLSWSGAQFDENGVLTNYKEFVEKLVAQYNKNAEANAKDKEAQYKFQEQLKDIQFYTETLNLYESETDKLIQLANQIIDSALKEITYRVEYEMEINGDLAKLLNFKADLVKDNVYRAAEYIALLGDEMENTAKDLEIVKDGMYSYLGQLAGENMRLGKEYSEVDLGIAEMKNGEKVSKNYDNIDFKQVSKNLDKWLEELRSKDAKAAEEVDKIIQRTEDGLIANYKDVLEKINEMNIRLSDQYIELLHNDVEAFFKELSNLKENPTWEGLSTEMKNQITSWLDQMISGVGQLRSKYKDIIEQLGDSIKEFNKKLGNEVDEFDYYKDLYNNMEDIINLTNRHMTDITSDFFKALNSKVFDNNINKIKATNTQYKTLQQTYAQVKEQYDAMVERMQTATNEEERKFWQDQVDNLKDQLDTANSAMEDAAKDFQTAWKDALEGAKTAYEDAVKEASRSFEESFSPFFNTIALLEAQFGREKQLADLYVDDYQRIHDLSRLNRDIQNSILDTDNIRSKERLRELQKEINKLQEDGTELSEYDLDILDKKYKLELARQALEDAKDAKSLVRLSRDNNGNWGYIYTSNEDEVAEAEQNYEDAIREMEEANENYIDNIQDQIINVQKEAQEAIANLSPDDFATYDEYLAAVQNITNAMMQNMNYLRQQLNNAFGNNTYLDPYIVNRYGINDHNLTDDFQDTILSGLLGADNMNQVVQDALNRINDLATASSEAFVELQQNQEQIYEAAEHNINLIGAQMGAETEVIAEASAHQVQVVENLSERIADAFTDTANTVANELNEWAGKVYDLTQEYSDLLEVITELKRLDGEYVEPEKFMTTDEAIDDWREISEFKKALAANGQVAYIRTNSDMEEEFVDMFTAGSKAATNYIHDAMEKAAKKEAIDVGDKLNTRDEYNKVIKYLEKRGVVVVKEGDNYHTIWSKDDEWLKKRLKAIEDAEKAAAAAAAGYSGGGGGDTSTIGNYTGPGSLKDVAKQITNGQSSYGQYVPATILAYAYQTAYGDTGMYTGEWAGGSIRRNGRLAFLHQKELVLNEHDTENFLDAMNIVRQLDNLTNWMANGLGDLFVPTAMSESDTLEQNVRIEASFPNVTDHNEIEQAFDNLVNRASQYANRKAI